MHAVLIRLGACYKIQKQEGKTTLSRSVSKKPLCQAVYLSAGGLMWQQAAYLSAGV